MENKICRNCKSPNIKLIPAGISKKSGKSYKAFYSCPDCKMTESSYLPQKPVETPNFAKEVPSNDKFGEIMGVLHEIQDEVHDIYTKLNEKN